MTEKNMSEQKGRAAATGNLNVEDARIGIVASRFNSFVVDRLVAGAEQTLAEHGIGNDRITILRVPGAFELPLAASELATTGCCDAVIALGVVIRGETAHFDYVCSQASAGLMRVSLDHGLPLGFGLLTVDTEAQALARAGDEDNKGCEAVQAALEMLALKRDVRR
ncbi:6,7-dimethyl-8-ribityllumazine synthase [Methylohalomonas lacus]|uniref:6,7-dimethyl-8-ribityllumazine synthase n=1 Tax=Methylohalomonas lacus TaxID=398773 RepID=A0AAE3L0X3_9GAMM|nr:6,7-dimethyl-8-ribityllumazine synthase [Methylohalomonas lacus]MCS3902306.1 6,7-dimethyl-8-ribityllumazine synthase [Methylohalomonas lacus]